MGEGQLGEAKLGRPPWLRGVLDAYGGETRWHKLESFDLTATLTGTLFRLKCWGRLPPPGMHIHAEVHRPKVRIEPIDRNRGHVMIVDGRDARLETASGSVVREQKDMYGHMSAGKVAWKWDPMAMGYFLGQAIWNYMTLPALLVNPEIVWTEVGEGKLESKFPPHLPTQGRSQMHTFDLGTGRLLRYDYWPELAFRSPRANGANEVLERAEANGIPYESHRVVRIAPARGKPFRWPVMVEMWFSNVVYR